MKNSDLFISGGLTQGSYCALRKYLPVYIHLSLFQLWQHHKWNSASQ